MKRITVSIPDELVERVKRAAQGERTDLTAALASWNTETPIPEEVRRQVQLEMDEVGLTGAAGDS